MAVKTEGGMAATSNPLLAERMRRCPSTACPATRGIAMAELASWIINVAPGPEYNLTGISAALEVHQLRRVNRDAKVRERLHTATPCFGLLPQSGVPTCQTIDRMPGTWIRFVSILISCRSVEAYSIDKARGVPRLPGDPGICILYYRGIFGWTTENIPVASLESDRLTSGLSSRSAFAVMSPGQADSNHKSVSVRRFFWTFLIPKRRFVSETRLTCRCKSSVMQSYNR